MKYIRLNLLLLILLSAASCFAQDRASRKIILKFDDEMVDGKVDMPELTFLSAKKQTQFKKFIKLRSHFTDEIARTKSQFNGR